MYNIWIKFYLIALLDFICSMYIHTIYSFGGGRRVLTISIRKFHRHETPSP